MNFEQSQRICTALEDIKRELKEMNVNLERIGKSIEKGGVIH